MTVLTLIKSRFIKCGHATGAAADRLEAAIEKVLADGVRTADLLAEEGVQPVSTSEMGDAIVAALDESL